VNSDVDSPVLAKVVLGAFKGARLIGAFKRDGRILSMAFESMVLPGGRKIALKAVAVSPRDNSPAIPASVDGHLLERWGGLMAASFLEGLGEAMRGRGTTVRSQGDLLVAEREGASAGDLSIEALGRVGGRAAAQLEKGFDRPPTVTVKAGTAIGVLIVSAEAEAAGQGRP
jgi:intracellular multiplication protein IcmE